MKKPIIGIFVGIIGALISLSVKAQGIQNTFFNMRLGSVLTEQTIKSNVGSRGYFNRFENRGNCKRYLFDKLIFGGDTWMWGEFELTRDNHFYEFSVRNAYDSRWEADRYYSQMLDRLKDKYTNEIENDKDGERVTYFFGEDDFGGSISLHLSYRKSTGQDWYYYVELCYYSQHWLGKMVQDAESEL